MVRVSENSPTITARPLRSSSPLLVEDRDVVETYSPVGRVLSGFVCGLSSALPSPCSPDPPKDASLVQSKRVYMTRSKSLFAPVLPIPSTTPLSVVDTASRKPSRSRHGAAGQSLKPFSL
ncbi:hypothetical protein Peur_000984 [Populus x canadensis]